MQLTRVLLADDHILFRCGVRGAIEQEDDIKVVGEAGDGAEALAKALELKPDLILMDINMPHCDGLEAVSAIKGALPGVKIVMLTVYDQDECLFEAVKRGAEGFLSKNVRAGEILDSVRKVMQGQAALSGWMSKRILDEFARMARDETNGDIHLLTVREKQVLQEISKGLSNREIAESLVISENTVKAHVTSILRKLHLKNRSQAADYVRSGSVRTRSARLPAADQGIRSR
jgi:DNA-binding NarL/FixJ family response regulator